MTCTPSVEPAAAPVTTGIAPCGLRSSRPSRMSRHICRPSCGIVVDGIRLRNFPSRHCGEAAIRRVDGRAPNWAGRSHAAQASAAAPAAPSAPSAIAVRFAMHPVCRSGTGGELSLS